MVVVVVVAVVVVVVRLRRRLPSFSSDEDTMEIASLEAGSLHQPCVIS